MADGKISHGGFADRLKGLMALYYYTKIKGAASFKIYFVSPFDLRDYLEPNSYNWSISDSQLSYDKNRSKSVIVKFHRSDNLKYIDKRLSTYLGNKQLHVYTNASLKDEENGDDGNE